MTISVLATVSGDKMPDSEQVCLFLEKMFGALQETAPAMTSLSQWGMGVGASALIIGGWTVFAGVRGMKTAPDADKSLYRSTRQTGLKIAAAGMALMGGIMAAELTRDSVTRYVPPVAEEAAHVLWNQATPAERTAYVMVAMCELAKGRICGKPYRTVQAIGEMSLLFNDSFVPSQRRDVLAAAHAGAYQFYFKQKDTHGLVILNHEYAFLSGLSAFVRPGMGQIDLNAVLRRESKER